MSMTPQEAPGNLVRHRALAGAALLTIGVALAACSTLSSQRGPQSTQSSPSAKVAMTGPEGSSSARTGTFQGVNDKHVSGTVNVAAGQLVLSGFSSDAAPDLHVHLTTGADENAVRAGRELGIVAFDKASQTFSIGAADASKYNTVVINCDKANAVFGAATLS